MIEDKMQENWNTEGNHNRNSNGNPVAIQQQGRNARHRIPTGLTRHGVGGLMRTEEAASRSVDGTKGPPIARAIWSYRSLSVLSSSLISYLSAVHHLPIWKFTGMRYSLARVMLQVHTTGQGGGGNRGQQSPPWPSRHPPLCSSPLHSPRQNPG